MRRSGRACLVAAAALALVAGCNQSGRPRVVQVQQTYGAPPPAPATVVTTSGEEYSVIPGDTVYGVAERFQVPIRSLIELNNLQPPYRLAPGTKLRLPERREYVVQPGDNIYDISRRFGVDSSTLIRLNNIPAPYAVTPGQRLMLPAPVQAPSAVASSGDGGPAPAAAPSAAVTVEELPPLPGTSMSPSGTAPTAPQTVPTQPTPPAAAPSGGAAPATTGETPAAQPQAAPAPPAQTAAVPTPDVPQPAPLTGGKFLWPVNGKIVSGFGPREGGLHNDGINIAAPLGTPIRAAENGVVAYAGNELRGFGNMLLIRHADGWMSAYAHADTLLVKRGDSVVRGQTIARVGQTGNVSSPQLHFELRRGTEAVDPVKYLGELGAALPVSPADGRGGRPDPG